MLGRLAVSNTSNAGGHPNINSLGWPPWPSPWQTPWIFLSSNDLWQIFWDPADQPQSQKTSLVSQKQVIFDSQSLQQTRFWLLSGGRPGPLGDFSGDSFWTFPNCVQTFTLPALQKTFVDSFFELAWEFCIEKWRGFLVIFSGLRLSVSHEMKHENSSKKSGRNRSKIQAALDGVPLTGLQLLRWERVLLTLWLKGLEHSEKWSKVVAPSGPPLKNSMKN